MTIEVLKTASENKAARIEMRRRGIDCTSPFLIRVMRRMGIVKGASIGEYCKSWDVLKSLQFIHDNVPSSGAPILDIGAYASEVLCSLHKLGYTNLTGVDLNPALKHMPYGDKINYVVSDFMSLPFSDASFSAVTAISVIEHGFEGKKLLKELARILKPGGYFIASVDYWPEKIDTTGIKAFGMDWLIFSKEDLLSFVKEAEQFELCPYGEMNFDASERIVRWKGKQYTFAWLVLRKK